MAKLLMMRGLPASGKSTRAKEIMREAGNMVRVNRDELRPMLHGGAKWSGKKEKITRHVQRAMVVDLLDNDYSVIVDDTNLRAADEERWRHVSGECNASFEVVDMDTPYEVCVDRDLSRDDGVGVHVVTSMALSSGRFPYRSIVLCDIDGTIADLSHRLHYVNGERRDWDAFFAEVGDDDFRRDVWERVVSDARAHDARIIFLSGRSDVARDDTETWLWQHCGGDIDIPIVLMRREFDRRPDTEVKRDIFEWNFGGYNIVRVYDDRPRLVRMWREMGLDVVDCGDGIDF
jgi:predicted kinase